MPTVTSIVVWATCGCVAAVSLGCGIGVPFDAVYPADVSRTIPTYQGFTVGHRYIAAKPLAVWRDRDRFTLLATEVAATYEWGDARLGDLPAGTPLSVAAIRRWDTIELGYKYWVELRADAGPLEGKRLQVHESLIRDARPDSALLIKIGEAN